MKMNKNVTTALLAGLILSSMRTEAMGFKLSERGWKFWATATALVASVSVLTYKVLAKRSTFAWRYSPHSKSLEEITINWDTYTALLDHHRKKAQENPQLIGYICTITNGIPTLLPVEEKATTAHNLRAQDNNYPAPSSAMNRFKDAYTSFGFNTELHMQIKSRMGIDQYAAERMTLGYISAQDECGNNALHMAAQYGEISSISILAQYIDINTQNDQGNTALHEAILTAYNTPMSYAHLHELLTDMRARNILKTADIQTQDTTISALLCMPGINLDIANQSGFTPREYLQAYNALANPTDIQVGEISVPATGHTSIRALKQIIAERITPPVQPAERITLVRNGMASEAPNNQLVGLTRKFQMTINNDPRFTPPLRGAHYDAR